MLPTAVEMRPTRYYFRVPSRNGTKGAHNRHREKNPDQTKKALEKILENQFLTPQNLNLFFYSFFWIKRLLILNFVFSCFAFFSTFFLLRCFQEEKDKSNTG